MYWTLELASKLEDAPWPATKDELIDYAVRSGAPLEVIENLNEIEDEGDIYESIEDIWPDYPSKDDFFFNEEEYGLYKADTCSLIGRETNKCARHSVSGTFYLGSFTTTKLTNKYIIKTAQKAFQKPKGLSGCTKHPLQASPEDISHHTSSPRFKS